MSKGGERCRVRCWYQLDTIEYLKIRNGYKGQSIEGYSLEQRDGWAGLEELVHAHVDVHVNVGLNQGFRSTMFRWW